MEKVKSYKRRIMGKWANVSGYSRPERPKGRKHSIKRINYGYSKVSRDKYGHIIKRQ